MAIPLRPEEAKALLKLKEAGITAAREYEAAMRKMSKILPIQNIRGILIADFLVKTYAMIDRWVCLVRDTGRGTKMIYVGRLHAVNPEHLDVILVDYVAYPGEFKGAKTVIRGDEVSSIDYASSRDEALKIASAYAKAFGLTPIIEVPKSRVGGGR